MQSIARQIEIPAEEGTAPLVVFNPHPWPLRADVELEFAGFREGDAVMDDAAVQRTRSHATVSPPRARIVFAAEVPPLGYRLYRLRPGRPSESSIVATDTTLANEYIALEVDPQTGWLARLDIDGVNVAAPGRHAVVVDDRSDTWGHGVGAYDDAVGAFECTAVRLVEHGPVRAVLRIESRYGSSTLAEELVLSADARHVDVRVALDWHERLKLLKLRFPTTVETESATFEIPYGNVERAAAGDEEPAQSWVDVSGGAKGLSVCNDAKYGHDARGGEIGITVVRSPVYAWHEPKELDEDGVYEWMDQGRQDFTVRLVPHAGDRRAAGTVRLAAELNQPPFALLESFHDGSLPAQASYASSDGVVLTVLKAGEDGDGSLVVRAYESEGRPAHATIDLPLLDRTIEAEFSANEIKTFRVRRYADGEIVETNLLEW